MSKAKRTIVDAKQSKLQPIPNSGKDISTNSTKTSVEPRPAPPGEDLSGYWGRSAGDTVEGKHAQLRALGFNDRNSFMNQSVAEPLNESALSKRAAEEKKGSPLNVEASTGWSESAKLQTLSMLDDMYRSADKMGYKTADQFRTAYENLKNSSPRTKALSTDPKWIAATQSGGADLKNVAAEHFARLVRGRDEERAKAAPAAAPTAAPAAASATPASKVMLKVNKA